MDVPPPPESADAALPRAAEIAEPDLAPQPIDPAVARADPAPGNDAVIREIETDFPGWGVWHSDTRRWWAFRTAANPLTIDQLRAGCRLIVQADTGSQLRAAIHAEIECARRSIEL